MTDHDMAAQQDVNTADQGSCGTCGCDSDMKFTIQCEECKNWIHYTCSALPLYLLLCLARTTRKYTCEKCSFDKYADPKWTAEASEAMDRMKRGKTSQLPTNATSEDSNDQETPPPSLTPPDPPQEEARMEEAAPETQVEPPATSTTANTGESNNLSQPTNSIGKPAPVVDKRKLVVCKFYLRNECRFGAAGRNCRNAHPKICSKFMKQGLDERVGCRLGWKCVDYHPLVCRDSLHKRVCERRFCKYPHIKETKITRRSESNNPRPAQQMETPTTIVPQNAGAHQVHTDTQVGEPFHLQPSSWPTTQQSAKTRSTAPAYQAQDQNAFLGELMNHIIGVEKKTQFLMQKLLAQTEAPETSHRGKCSCH